jgi:ABC-type branched-subunit amino acid transport system substrate-binding protein
VRFEKRFSRQPIYTDAFGYDMAMIIHDSSKRVHLPATNQQWLEALRSTNISGVTGTLKFDDNGDLITPVEAGVYRNGTLVPIAK